MSVGPNVIFFVCILITHIMTTALIAIEYTGKAYPAFKATFDIDGRTKTVRFGTKSNFVTNDSKTTKDRTNYIKRHRVNEDWEDPMSRGALSRFLLWGKSRSLFENIKSYRKRFNV